ncbi:DUF6121 family protein [Glaciibacter sp. 2TAF33]|uniref:DUF6121 family protein n=1 Tax=Glaciibacter sp. 2TAF33 TaxID=3233015 RepID=UPI003F8F5763
MRDYQKYATIVAIFATVLYLAAIVAAFGLISLATDQEVISEPNAGPLVGPTMTGASVAITCLLMLIVGLRTPPERQRIAPGYALATGIAALGVFIVVGGLLAVVGDGQPFHLITFSAGMLISPFAWAVGGLGFVVTLLYSWILALRFGERGRPLWPWERRGD